MKSCRRSAPTKPPTVLFGPVLVTAPVALEVDDFPWPISKDERADDIRQARCCRHRSRFRLPSWKELFRRSCQPRPPAILASPTDTLPRAPDPAMMAVSFAQPAQVRGYLQNLRLQDRRRCCRRPPAHFRARRRTGWYRNCRRRDRRPAGSQRWPLPHCRAQTSWKSCPDRCHSHSHLRQRGHPML